MSDTTAKAALQTAGSVAPAIAEVSMLAGCFTMAKGAISGVETGAIAVGVLLILLQYKINPALLVLGGAVNRAAVVFPQMMDGNAPKDFRRAPAVPYGSTIPLSERPPAP